MLTTGPAVKVIVHLNDDTIAQHDYLSREILEFLFARGVAGASVIRPDAGFGSHRRLHEAGGGIDRDRHMPVRIEFIESPDAVNALLPDLTALLTDGVIEAHDTHVVKVAVGE